MIGGKLQNKSAQHASRQRGRRTDGYRRSLRSRWQAWIIQAIPASLRQLLGNLLIIAGVYLVLFVGGLYVQIEYQRLAARGDNDLTVPQAVIPAADPSVVQPRFGFFSSSTRAEPNSGSLAAFDVPLLNDASGLASEAAFVQESTVSRIILPSVRLDAKVIEVGWSVIREGNQEVAVWDVAEYAVGQHRGSANPGQGGNVVLAGHVGGLGAVFRDLYYVLPGDPLILHSDGQEYRYVITERFILEEENAPPEQRAENAQLIAPTDSEVVTLVTCWPPTGPDKFTQRVVLQAEPYRAPADLNEGAAVWHIR